MTAIVISLCIIGLITFTFFFTLGCIFFSYLIRGGINDTIKKLNEKL